LAPKKRWLENVLYLNGHPTSGYPFSLLFNSCERKKCHLSKLLLYHQLHLQFVFYCSVLNIEFTYKLFLGAFVFSSHSTSRYKKILIPSICLQKIYIFSVPYCFSVDGFKSDNYYYWYDFFAQSCTSVYPSSSTNCR